MLIRRDRPATKGLRVRKAIGSRAELTLVSAVRSPWAKTCGGVNSALPHPNGHMVLRTFVKGVSSSRPLALSGKDPWTEGSIISATQEAVQDKVIPGPEFNR